MFVWYMCCTCLGEGREPDVPVWEWSVFLSLVRVNEQVCSSSSLDSPLDLVWFISSEVRGKAIVNIVIFEDLIVLQVCGEFDDPAAIMAPLT